jgi:hypothetical protein
VTKAQIQELGLQQLIGTNAARAYMHGYFIELKTYQRARGQNQLSAAEAYRERKLAEKLEKERAVHFVKRKANVANAKLPKVNRELASRLQAELCLQREEDDEREEEQMEEEEKVGITIFLLIWIKKYQKKINLFFNID